jgi:hypothetical protein
MEEQIKILNRKRGIAKRSLGYIEEFLNDFDRNPVVRKM